MNASGGFDYWTLLHRVKDMGSRADSRVGPVREFLNVQLSIHPLQLPRRMKMRRELGYMEYLQFISGIHNVEALARVAPKIDFSLFGDSAIYGPRVWTSSDLGDVDQLDNIIQELKENPQSRRALLVVSDIYDPLSSQPCISSFQFQIRHKVLYLTVNVRSWDLWFGAPHDLILFSGLAQLVAMATGCVGLGNMTINAANAHIYEEKIDLVGGPAMQWYFKIPSPDSSHEVLDYYRAIAVAAIEYSSWVSGPPPGFTEEFPAIPALKPMRAGQK